MKTKPFVCDIVLEDGQRLERQPVKQSKFFYFTENGLRFDYASGESLNHEFVGLSAQRLDLGTLRLIRSAVHFTFTHCARIKPTGRGGIAHLRLRETGLTWVDEKGRKYKKSELNGFSTCNKFRILPNTLQPLDPSGALPMRSK